MTPPNHPGPRRPIEDHTIPNRATYDRIASLYTDRQHRHRARGADEFGPFERAFLASLPGHALVGDLACGPALDAARFAEQGYRAVGVDLSKAMLAQATQVLAGRVAQGDLRALPLAGQRLDGIWCCAALLHVPVPHTTEVLREFRRVIRLGGYLALITALGDGSDFEDVDYAPGERRWFVYRRPEDVRTAVRQARFAIATQDRIASSRDWMAVLARAV